MDRSEAFQNEHPAVVEWLNNYTGNFGFYLSLQDWFQDKGWLSDKQREAVERAIAKASAPRPTRTMSYNAGDRVEIKAWVARRLAEEKSMPFFFRNLEVVECLKETEKAIQVKVKFISEVATSCHCCGRKLDCEISRATGIGPVCAKKYLKIARPTLANAQEILDKINEEASIAGVVGPIWIPKSQIVKSESPRAAAREAAQRAKNNISHGLSQIRTGS